MDHFYQIAEMTIQVISDIPIKADTYSQKFLAFQVGQQGSDRLTLHHHFSLPDLSGMNIQGKPVYRTPPWAIFHHQDGWIYLGIAVEQDDPSLHRVVLFNQDHTFGHIYNPNGEIFLQGNVTSLTLFPTDQIWLARVLADRQGCYLHAAGMILNGAGFLFVGHSEAGKSTLVRMLQEEGEILCDDRMIVRRWEGDHEEGEHKGRPYGTWREGDHEEGDHKGRPYWRVYGTWSHGDIPIVSPNSAPLRAMLLLEQAPHNRLIPITDSKEIVRRLPFFVIKPLVTADWWEKTLDLVGQMGRELPVYRLQFDQSGGVRQTLKALY